MPNLQLDHLPIELQMDYLTAYAYLIFGTCSFVSSVTLFLITLKSKFAEPPGNLVRWIAFSEAILSAHWFTSAVFTTWIYNKTYGPGSLFCITNSILSVVAALVEYFYNVFFLGTIIYKMSKLVNKKEIVPTHILAHTVSWVIPIAVGVYGYFFDMFGMSNSGTCSFGARDSDGVNKGLTIGTLATLISSIVLIFLALGTLAFLVNVLPKDSKQAMIMKEEFLEFYRDYVIALIVYYVASIWVMFVPCNSTSDTTFHQLMRTIARIANIFKVQLPLTLFVIRTKDPQIHSEVKEVFNRLGRCIWGCFSSKYKYNDDEELMTSPGLLRKKSSKTIDLEDKRLMQITDQSNGVMWFNVIGMKLRHAIIRTIVNFIGQIYCQTISDNGFCDEDIQKWTITDNDKSTLYEISSEVFMGKYKMRTDIYDCYVTVYYAKKFKEQFDMTSRSPAELLKAFSLENCIKIVEKIQAQDSRDESDGAGGASGELFVMSLNKKFILKTICFEEGKVFSTMIEDKRFFEHFLEDNPRSIMPRIFGYFEFNFTKLNGKKQYVIIMENLSPVNSDCVIRKFDLKGSTIGREVLKKSNDPILNDTPPSTLETTEIVPGEMAAELKKYSQILKDIDFKNLEPSGISVKSEVPLHVAVPVRSVVVQGEEMYPQHPQNAKRDQMLQDLKIDVEYLMENKIMDYSLLITKIDLEKLTLDAVDRLDKRGVLIKSDARIGYLVGLIDFFQVWNTGKRLERFGKYLSKFRCKLDISAQPPIPYAERFKKFLENHVFPDELEVGL